MITKLLENIGKSLINLITGFGDFTIFQLKIFFLFFKPPFRFKQLSEQIMFMGYGSLGVIFLTSFFTGLVEAVQLYKGFHKFGVEDFMGYTVFISIVKELGPVFAALMVISRGISSYAAELGSMRVTEQIDALEVMAVDSKHYLIVPRILGTIISLPLLIIFFDAVANVGSYLISVYSLNVNPYAYMDNLRQFAQMKDIDQGIVKGIVFAYIISAIGTYIGYNTSGGAKGVGQSTTKAVVFASVAIFIADYIMAALFLVFW